MIDVRHKYYEKSEDMPRDLKSLIAGCGKIRTKCSILDELYVDVYAQAQHLPEKESRACVTSEGKIYARINGKTDADEWAHIIAHCILHLAFGHFDKQNLPADLPFIPKLWNKACDIYVEQFLHDMDIKSCFIPVPSQEYAIKLNDERKIYAHLLKTEGEEIMQTYGTNARGLCDMIGVEHPLVYKKGERNWYVAAFTRNITRSLDNAVAKAGGMDYDPDKESDPKKAAGWFMAHYPLLGGLASGFRIIDSVTECHRQDVQVAAVNSYNGVIFANTTSDLTMEEWIFVMGHEFLHAGLDHCGRCRGRDPYLWNIACDYVVNDWLKEMQIGTMPAGCLYDEQLHGMSVESVYDLIVKEMRKYKKLWTLRGYGKSDIMGERGPMFPDAEVGSSVRLDDFFKSALKEGLDYHQIKGRGYLPAGLVEEIKALSVEPIPWEVELAEWFDEHFPPVEKHRNYARLNRRQEATPDIPRPGYIIRDEDRQSRTFGVVIDTSGSMSDREIGMALGAVASYAREKEVSRVRVVFCDADATDAGYMSPEDLSGSVKVTGRGGTILTPGVRLLENAKDFPKTGPILVITDAEIEENLRIKREHAFLIPAGKRLPFKTTGKVFRYRV